MSTLSAPISSGLFLLPGKLNGSGFNHTYHSQMEATRTVGLACLGACGVHGSLTFDKRGQRKQMEKHDISNAGVGAIASTFPHFPVAWLCLETKNWLSMRAVRGPDAALQWWDKTKLPYRILGRSFGSVWYMKWLGSGCTAHLQKRYLAHGSFHEGFLHATLFSTVAKASLFAAATALRAGS